MTGASSYSGIVDGAFWFILGTSVLLLIGVTATMIYFAVRYSRKRNPVPAQIHGNLLLETIWTVIPTALVMVMFWYGWTGFKRMRDVPPDAMEIQVTARMWSWLFEYPGGQASTELVVPIGRPVVLRLRSEDVIHSLFIPAFRIKEDALPHPAPGQENYLWFEATVEGEYNILCAEYCGELHSQMLSRVRVLSVPEYDAWISNPDLGIDILALMGCAACHSIDGSKLVGPTFKGLWGSSESVLTDGSVRQVTVDEEYLRRSLAEPNADVVVGYPASMLVQEVTDDEFDQLVQRLEELK